MTVTCKIMDDLSKQSLPKAAINAGNPDVIILNVLLPARTTTLPSDVEGTR